MRIAIVNGAPYEAEQHAPIALKQGLTQAQLDDLSEWQGSRHFSEDERAILAFTDAMTRDSDKSRVLMAQIFIADMADFEGMNEVWDAWVARGDAPPRATVQANLARKAWRVEVVVTAGVN